MNIRDVLAFIYETEGRIFSVKFRKRSNNEERQMTCRTGVKKYLVANPSREGIDFAKNNLIGVYDMVAEGYRSIPVEGIFAIKIDGNWINVT